MKLSKTVLCLLFILHLAPGLAFASGWTWERSFPHFNSNTFNDIWCVDESNVFVVGEEGTILHYDGSAWSGMDSGTSANLGSVWGCSGTDVYAVGIETKELSGSMFIAYHKIFHYDGNEWSEVHQLEETVYLDSYPGPDISLEGVWGRRFGV